ncbi:ATP-dependent DNA helicase [Serratia fonticola AU-P3(3)]|nr:ATP-dependent DNA helicase [Serratia fonticola AU-P3(3)]
MEDVVKYHTLKRGIRSKVDYTHVKLAFESFHLPPGVNALEEIGIPIQTLHRRVNLLDFSDQADVDELCQYLRDTQDVWSRAIGYVDKRVTENAGRKIPGVDGETWQHPEAKWSAITRLRRMGYTPRPLRRIYIPKANGKRRPLDIPTILDRAMQALYLLGVEPVTQHYVAF